MQSFLKKNYHSACPVYYCPMFSSKAEVITDQELVSSENSDLCEISDLLLFFSYFASQNKEIKSGNHFFDVCCVNWGTLVRCQVPTTSYSTERTSAIEKFRTESLTSLIFLFLTLTQTLNPTHLPKHEFLSTKNQFYLRIWYVEYYSVHAYTVWSQKFRLTPDWIPARVCVFYQSMSR